MYVHSANRPDGEKPLFAKCGTVHPEKRGRSRGFHRKSNMHAHEPWKNVIIKVKRATRGLWANACVHRAHVLWCLCLCVCFSSPLSTNSAVIPLSVCAVCAACVRARGVFVCFRAWRRESHRCMHACARRARALAVSI